MKTMLKILPTIKENYFHTLNIGCEEYGMDHMPFSSASSDPRTHLSNVSRSHEHQWPNSINDFIACMILYFRD